MIELKDAKVLQVVAFDENHNPVRIDEPNSWKIEINDKISRLTLNSGKIRIEYNLGFHTLCLAQIGERERIHIGKTIGRTALTGMAFGLLNGRKAGGLGGALLDLSLRGSAKQKIINCYLVLNDSTTILIATNQENFSRIRAIVHPLSLTDEALNRTEKFLDLVKRMSLDGPRVISELNDKVEVLATKLAEAKSGVENGLNFEERDAARRLGQNLLMEMETQVNLRKAVEFYIQKQISISESGEDGSNRIPRPNSSQELSPTAIIVTLAVVLIIIAIVCFELRMF